MTSTFTQEEADQFIIECHSDLDTVKQKVAATPELVNAYNPKTIESALGAAGHMGRADIAEYLLENGAELELACAAMLGNLAYVANALAADPELARSGGAHNIPVAFHAAISGNTEIMQLLWDAGAEEQVRGALFGAIAFNENLQMTQWLLEHGASTEGKDFQGRSMLEVAEENGFHEIAELLKDKMA